jgi:hypothetical protein
VKLSCIVIEVLKESRERRGKESEKVSRIEVLKEGKAKLVENFRGLCFRSVILTLMFY